MQLTSMAAAQPSDQHGPRCPLCNGALSLAAASRFVSVALCPHAGCGQRLMVEVAGRDALGRAAEFTISSVEHYVGAPHPWSLARKKLLWPLMAAGMATTTCVATAWMMLRHAHALRDPGLETLLLGGLMFVAVSSWSILGAGWLTSRWVNAFLWRRAVSQEAPTTFLGDGTGAGVFNRDGEQACAGVDTIERQELPIRHR